MDYEELKTENKKLKRGKIILIVCLIFMILLAIGLAYYQYNSGYDKGQTIGYKSGTEAGYDKGTQEGYDSGTQEGYDKGYDKGYHKGYSKGKSDTKALANTKKSSSSDSSSTYSSSSSNDSADSGATVYITNTGSKYHSAGCRYLSRSCISISKSEAIAEGYSACSICDP